MEQVVVETYYIHIFVLSFATFEFSEALFTFA